MEQKRHLQSIAMQSFVFDHSKHTEKRTITTPQGISQQKSDNQKAGSTGTEYKQKKKKKKIEKEIKNEKSEMTEEQIMEIQSKYETVFHGRMRPDPCIAHHPAYATLFRYTTEGCPVNCGEPWSREHLEAAIQQGPHISAKSPEAAACLRQEAFEKVEQGEAEIIKWDDIKDAPHKNLKISPLAAVPHKSCQFRAILDLSFQLRLLGVKLPSVNKAMLPLSDHKAMEQMGQVLRRLINTVAQSNPSRGPLISIHHAVL